jgi:hypothetical protein
MKGLGLGLGVGISVCNASNVRRLISLIIAANGSSDVKGVPLTQYRKMYQSNRESPVQM